MQVEMKMMQHMVALNQQIEKLAEIVKHTSPLDPLQVMEMERLLGDIMSRNMLLNEDMKNFVKTT